MKALSTSILKNLVGESASFKFRAVLGPEKYPDGSLTTTDLEWAAVALARHKKYMIYLGDDGVLEITIAKVSNTFKGRLPYENGCKPAFYELIMQCQQKLKIGGTPCNM